MCSDELACCGVAGLTGYQFVKGGRRTSRSARARATCSLRVRGLLPRGCARIDCAVTTPASAVADVRKFLRSVMNCTWERLNNDKWSSCGEGFPWYATLSNVSIRMCLRRYVPCCGRWAQRQQMVRQASERYDVNVIYSEIPTTENVADAITIVWRGLGMLSTCNSPLNELS
jgi:hypothetical protein